MHSFSQTNSTSPVDSASIGSSYAYSSSEVSLDSRPKKFERLLGMKFTIDDAKQFIPLHLDFPSDDAEDVKGAGLEMKRKTLKLQKLLGERLFYHQQMGFCVIAEVDSDEMADPMNPYQPALWRSEKRLASTPLSSRRGRDHRILEPCCDHHCGTFVRDSGSEDIDVGRISQR